MNETVFVISTKDSALFLQGKKNKKYILSKEFIAGWYCTEVNRSFTNLRTYGFEPNALSHANTI